MTQDTKMSISRVQVALGTTLTIFLVPAAIFCKLAQDGPKTVPGCPQMRFRWPKMTPRWPKMTQDGPRTTLKTLRIARLVIMMKIMRPEVKISVSSRRELNFRGSWSPMLAPSWPKKAQDDPRIGIKWPRIGIKWPMMT